MVAGRVSRRGGHKTIRNEFRQIDVAAASNVLRSAAAAAVAAAAAAAAAAACCLLLPLLLLPLLLLLLREQPDRTEPRYRPRAKKTSLAERPHPLSPIGAARRGAARGAGLCVPGEPPFFFLSFFFFFLLLSPCPYLYRPYLSAAPLLGLLSEPSTDRPPADNRFNATSRGNC
jgi:hypothetical protein